MSHRPHSRTLILLNEKRVKQSEPWNSTRGIYADFKDGFDKPKYYCKCPNCHFVHGFYATPREAIARKLCNLCRFNDNEKLKKEVHQVAFAESDDFDAKAYVDHATDWEASLAALGFHRMWSGNTWEREWDDSGQRCRAEAAMLSDGRVFVQYYKPEGASWKLVRMDKVYPMELPAYFLDRHPSLSAQIVDHLLAG